MIDLAATRVLEFGVGDVLNLDFSWLGVDDASILLMTTSRSEGLRTVSVRCKGVRQKRHVIVGENRRDGSAVSFE